MPDVETMMEDVSQTVDKDEEDAMTTQFWYCSETLTDIDATVVPQQVS
jgi:hypothetical protein